jgi:hypothetical protein
MVPQRSRDLTDDEGAVSIKGNHYIYCFIQVAKKSPALPLRRICE